MKIFFRTLYSMILLGAGILHLVHEKSFRRTIPKIFPFKKAIVIVSGIFEIMFAIFLWVKKGQEVTSKLLAFFMIAVFPANIWRLKRFHLHLKNKRNHGFFGYAYLYNYPLSLEH